VHAEEVLSSNLSSSN